MVAQIKSNSENTAADQSQTRHRPDAIAPAPARAITLHEINKNPKKATESTPPLRSSKIAKTLALRAFTAVDFIALIAIATFVFSIFSPPSLGMAPFAISAPFVMIAPLITLGLLIAGAYGFAHNETLIAHWGKSLVGVLTGSALVILLGFWGQMPDQKLLALLLALAGSAVAILCLHAIYIALIYSWASSGALATNVVMIGATENAKKLIAENAKTGELNVAGIFEERLARAPKQVADIPVLGSIDDLLNWPHLPSIDRIIITVTSTATARVRTMIDRLRNLPQDLVLFVDMDDFNPQKTTLAQIAHAPMAFVSGGPRSEMRILTKRIQDIVFASLMLVAFAPVMVAVAIAIKLTSKGPVLFRQKRHGFNNQIIEVFKFRSMHVEQPDGPMQQVTDGDDRITPVGRFIRRTSLDELPQLINVLLGDMSLVGPRPHAIDMHTGDVQSRLLVAEYAHRHRVKPGLTGWAQVNGSRGPLHSAEDVRKRVRLDVEYIERADFWFDLWIMLKTAPCLLGDTQNTR